MDGHKAEMPDDALDPDSLVGRICNTERINNATWDSPMSVEMIGGRITDGQGEPIMEISYKGGQPRPLWEVMDDADRSSAGSCYEVGKGVAAKIEALRDWLLPQEPELPSTSITALPQFVRGQHEQRKILRDCLTEQARIARGES